jgi:putative transposase
MTKKRVVTLDAAFAAHPIRFKGVAPRPPILPTAARKKSQTAAN